MQLSCTSTATQSVSHSVTLSLDKSQTWQLVAIQGRPIHSATQSPSHAVTLIFNPEAGTATGQSYCNSYTFRCTLKNPEQRLDGDYYELELTPWGSGTLNCPEADKNAEARYLAFLAKATRLRLTATTLTLFRQDKEILHYELR